MASSITFAVLALQLVAHSGSGVVRGQVRSESTGHPLRFAVVEVVASNYAIARTSTDSAGHYTLVNVPAGRHLLRASHLDHAPLEVETLIPVNGSVSLDFDLAIRPVRLPPVTTRGGAWYGVHDTLAAGAPALGPASVKVLESTPGLAELGLAEVVGDVKGHGPGGTTDILYVRGGAADLKLVLLDGAPVYAPFHLGGLIHPLDASMLRSATLYLGGAPARYDGGLSYVMDMETRSGRPSDHATVGVDFLSARGTMEGPVMDRVTYLLGARGVHGLGAEPFTGGSFPYLYGDALGRIDVDLGKGARLTTTGFWNQESVRLDSLGGYGSEAVWGNTAGSLRFLGNLAEANAEIVIGLGSYTTELPVGGENPLTADGVARRLRVGINLDRPAGDNAHVFYGVSFDRMRFRHRAWPRPRTITSDTVLRQVDGGGEVAGAYVDGSWQVGNRVHVRGGLRADVFSLDPVPRLAPRLAATVLVGQRASVTLAAGQYRQYVRSFQSEPVANAIVAHREDEDKNSLSVASSSHFVLSLDQDLGEGLQLGIEGFYKMFDGVPSTTDIAERSEASGVDLWLRRDRGTLTGWLGYSLAWIWSVDGGSSTASSLFAGRHLVSAGLAGPIGSAGNFELRLAYGAGLPYTAIPEPEAAPVFAAALRADPPTTKTVIPTIPSAPDDPYLRIDLQVSRQFSAALHGFSFVVTPYFKLLNALDRRDALFYHFDRNGETPDTRPLAPLPVLPILGLEWKF